MTKAFYSTHPLGLPAGDPRAILAEAPMSLYQWSAVTIVGLLYVLDGFDVMAISFAAPRLLREWGISKAEMGYALSAGLFGMALGSLFLSPLADSMGRRRVLLAALVFMIAGTSWTAVSQDIRMLLASRLLTGLGMGAMIGVLSPLAAEYANAQRRDFVVSLTAVGYALGAILGGALSGWLLSFNTWRSIFYVGSGLGLLLLIISATWLLEPLEWLMARPGRAYLMRVNAYLRRCGHPIMESLPLPPVNRALPLTSLFAPELRKATWSITALYFCYTIPLFYMQTWAPALVVEIGLPASQAAVIAASMSVGGVLAGAFIAVTSLRINLKQLELTLLAGAACSIPMFILLPNRFAPLIIGALVMGFFLMGSMVGLYAIIGRTFPVHLRASGTGFVLGWGRLGSTLPPVLAGLLFTAGFSRVGVTLMMIAPLLVSLTLLAMLHLQPKGRSITELSETYSRSDTCH